MADELDVKALLELCEGRICLCGGEECHRRVLLPGVHCAAAIGAAARTALPLALAKITELQGKLESANITIATLSNNDTVRSIAQGLDDIKAGRIVPLDVVESGGWEPHTRALAKENAALTEQVAALRAALEVARSRMEHFTWEESVQVDAALNQARAAVQMQEGGE